MAYADYRLCDVCGSKTFYDARLNYEQGPSKYHSAPPFRIAGKEQADNPDALHKHGSRLDSLGDWAVICEDCAKTHKCVIVTIEAAKGESNA